MPLTAQMQTILAAMRTAGVKAVDTLTPVEARAQFAALLAARRTVVTPVGRVEDRKITAAGREIPIRLYWPARSGNDPIPAVIYFHGGGHVIGNIDTHDEITRAYCAGTGALVISVDYRKGPEHKFPGAVEDVAASIDWLHANAAALGVDPKRLALAGDSAGGNLAAVGAFHVRDAKLPPLALQVLVYPVTDYTLSADSYRRYADGYGVVTAKAMTWFQQHYLRSTKDAEDWRASPLRAASLVGLAPALVISAEYDVLHDEGVQFVEKLRAAGVPVQHETYAGVIHGFFAMTPAVDEANAAQRLASSALRKAFGAGG